MMIFLIDGTAVPYPEEYTTPTRLSSKFPFNSESEVCIFQEWSWEPELADSFVSIKNMPPLKILTTELLILTLTNLCESGGGGSVN